MNYAILGATSGIGEALARLLVREGHSVGITGRRTERLETIKRDIEEASSETHAGGSGRGSGHGSAHVPGYVPGQVHIQTMDVTQPEEAWDAFLALEAALGHIDVCVLNAGVSNYQGSRTVDVEAHVIQTNAVGFAAMFRRVYERFEQQGWGHLVGVSSVAGLIGYYDSAAYCASKAFVSNYMQGYRQLARRSHALIHVTDVRPGYIDTPMTEGKQNMFWVVSADEAAKHMFKAIRQKKARAYVPPRWMLAGWVLRYAPAWITDRI